MTFTKLIKNTFHIQLPRLRLTGYAELYRQRRALAALDDHLLNDIGLNPSDAHDEATRPIWDAPSHWKS